MTTWLSYYVHPTSLTWLTGVASFLSGLFLLAAMVFPSLAPYAATLGSLWSGQTAVLLIGGGLASIGLKSGQANSLAMTLDAIARRAPLAELAGDVGGVVASFSGPTAAPSIAKPTA